MIINLLVTMPDGTEEGHVKFTRATTIAEFLANVVPATVPAVMLEINQFPADRWQAHRDLERGIDRRLRALDRENRAAARRRGWHC